jgi:hypothetical protein
MNAFKPHLKGTLAIAANATAQAVALPLGGGGLLRLINNGPQLAFMELTSNANTPVITPTSTGGGLPILANAPAEVFRIPEGTTHIALLSSGNATVYVSRGDVQ